MEKKHREESKGRFQSMKEPDQKHSNKRKREEDMLSCQRKNNDQAYLKNIPLGDKQQ